MNVRVLDSLAFSLTLGLVAAPLVAHAYHFKMPWRGDSLPANSYLASGFTHSTANYDCKTDPLSGKRCGWDFEGFRWTGTAWTKSKTTSGAPTSNEDYVGYDAPLYSPVDGEIVACWNTIPDELFTGGEPMACLGASGGACIRGGNHVFIRTDDNELVFLSHMKAGTIPTSVCPLDPTLPLPGLTEQGVNAFCDLPSADGWKGMQDPTKINGARPRVRKGDLVGHLGASGGVDFPHIHIGAGEYATDSMGRTCFRWMPWEIEEAWFHEKLTTNVTDDGWTASHGIHPVPTGDMWFVWGDPQGPRTDDLDLEAGSDPALALTPAGGVAAFVNANSRLEAVGFNIVDDSDFDIGIGHEDTVNVLEVDVARISDTSNHVVAVAKTQGGLLRLVPYFVQADADVVRGTVLAPATTAKLVAVTPAGQHSGVVVAYKNTTNELTVADYKTSLAGETLSLTAGGTASTIDDIDDIDIATVLQGRGASQNTGQWKGVVTAEVRSGTQNVYVRSFAVNATGTTVTPVDVQVGLNTRFGGTYTASDVDITVTGGDDGREFLVVSSIIYPSGALRVQSWEISNTGQLSPLDQVDGGTVSHIASARVGLRDAMVGARIDSNHGLTTLSFHVATDGEIRRVGTRDAGTINSLALDGRYGQDDMVVFSPLESTGEVRLIHYITNYSALY